MVGVGRMPHPEEEAEKQEGHDVQGGSGHCACAKVVIPGRIMQRFDPTPIPICVRPVARLRCGADRQLPAAPSCAAPADALFTNGITDCESPQQEFCNIIVGKADIAIPNAFSSESLPRT